MEVFLHDDLWNEPEKATIKRCFPTFLGGMLQCKPHEQLDEKHASFGKTSTC